MSAQQGRLKLKRIADQLSDCALVGLSKRFLVDRLTAIINASIKNPTDLEALAQQALGVKASKGERLAGTRCTDADIERFKREYQVQDDPTHARNRIREVIGQLLVGSATRTTGLNRWLPDALYLISRGALPSKVFGLHGKRGRRSNIAKMNAKLNLEALLSGWIEIAIKPEPEGLGMTLEQAFGFYSDTTKNNLEKNNATSKNYRADSSIKRIWSKRRKDISHAVFSLYRDDKNN